MKKNKPTETKRETWVEVQVRHSQTSFDETAKDLIWQLTTGGGSKNMHILDSIRNLEFAYLKCAAYTMAARDQNST